MKYYSEETVKKIVKDAMNYGMTISSSVPMDINNYPVIEIKEPHGDLIDRNEVKKLTTILVQEFEKHYGIDVTEDFLRMAYEKTIENAPTVVEASK